MDYALFLERAIDYAIPRVHGRNKKEGRKKLVEIESKLLEARDKKLYAPPTSMAASEKPFALVGGEAHLAVWAITTFVEGARSSRHQDPISLSIINHGREVLELVRSDDIPDKTNL